jgi:hypothetical protein
VAVVLMVAGIAMFGVITASIAAYFVEQKAEQDLAGRLDRVLEHLDAIEARLSQRAGEAPPAGGGSHPGVVVSTPGWTSRSFGESDEEGGETRTPPSSPSAASLRPHPAVDLQVLVTRRDRWCPLRSSGRRSGVYPACTAGSGPFSEDASSARLRDHQPAQSVGTRSPRTAGRTTLVIAF